jgi:ribosome biogenesis GTPase
LAKKISLFAHFFIFGRHPCHQQTHEKNTNSVIVDMRGLVIRTTGSWYKILPEDGGAVVDCRLRGQYRLRGNRQTNPVAVGDIVNYTLMADGTGVIDDVCDRKNYIVRKATKLSKQTHVIAANIDRLFVVATLGFPRTSTGFIDRLLVTAEAYHIPAAVVFNKVDLYGEQGSELWELHNEVKSLYVGAGYPVYEVSALTGVGINQLRQELQGRISLFTGHSGVGKSALLNAIQPQLELKVGEVSEWSLKGKHTTTFAELFPLGKQPSATDGFIIDTPGIKEFGMVDIKKQELSHFFPEMRDRLHDCHFANCTHLHEPQCAVRDAVERGEIASERYHNYLNILEDLQSES